MTLQTIEDDPISLYIGEGEGNVINVINQNSKQIYKVIRNKKNRTPVSVSKWEKRYTNLHVTPNFWENTFLAAFRATRETKLQSLQYKIINNIVPTRKYLFNRKGIDSPACLFCGEEDNIHHFFLFCDDVLAFLECVSNLVSDVLKLPLRDVEESEFMLGLLGKESMNRMLNAVIMHVKFYIYRQ